MSETERKRALLALRDHVGFQLVLKRIDSWNERLDLKMMDALPDSSLENLARARAVLMRVRRLLTDDIERIGLDEEREVLETDVLHGGTYANPLMERG
jgi:hypothetical protein